jgi:hypothetical protein
MKGRFEMRDIYPVYHDTLEVMDRVSLRFFDFERIQVAPQPVDQKVEFHTLSLSERQKLIEKLINRVKSL